VVVDEQGAQGLEFICMDKTLTRKLYFNSVPAYTSYPTRKVIIAQELPETMSAPMINNKPL